MKAQISLEYLLVFSVSVSILFMVLPVVSKVEGVSRKIVTKSRLDSLARKASSGCEELLSLGKDSVFIAKVPFPIKSSSKEDTLIVSSGELDSKVGWRDSCRLNSDSFSAGDEVRVLKDLT